MRTMTSHYDTANRERWRHLRVEDAGRIAIVSFGIFGLSMAILVGMGFQPGWANGWPISKHTVFASFVTIMLVGGLVSLANAGLVMLSYAVEQFAKRPFVGWSSFLLLIFLLLLATAVSSPRVYAIVHAAIVQDWK